MATVSGVVLDIHGRPAIDALVTLRSRRGLSRIETSTADNEGRFRVRLVPDSYVACAQPKYEVERNWKVPASPLGSVPVPACFSSSRSESASLRQFNPGETIGLLRITLGEERAYSVRGRIITRVAKTASWTESVWAVSNSPRALLPGADIPEYDYFPGRIDERSGRFVIHGLRAGAYTIVARSGPESPSDTAPLPPRFQDWRHIQLSGSGSFLVLTIGPHVTVRGRVVYQGYTSSSRMTVLLDSGMPPGSALDLSSDTGGEDQFRIPDVSPGKYTIDVDNEDQAVYVAGIRQDGREMPGARALIPDGRPTDLEVRVRKSTAAIRVKLLGDPVTTYGSFLSATAIPQGAWEWPAKWIVKSVPAAGTKEVIIGPLIPGTYLVFLTRNAGAFAIEAWHDEVKRHAGDAVRVIVKDGTTEAVSVRSVFLNTGIP